MEYKRSSQRLFSTGVDLSHPVDALPEGSYPYLNNVRSYQNGALQTRTGLTRLNSSATAAQNINSMFRMNDYVSASYARFLGIDTSLYFGTTAFSSIDTGYSGNPISFVNYLPIKAVSGSTYVADANKMRRVDIAGNPYQMGIAPPKILPTAELIAPAYTTPTGVDATSPFGPPGGWGHTTNATAPTYNALGNSRLLNVSIGTIKYISGSTGWACIAPTGGTGSSGTSAIVAGMRITIGTGGGGTSIPTGNVEYATVEEVHKIYPASGTTIGGILYDSGTSGLCTIEPSANMAGITRNSLLQLGGSEYIRVISVTAGNNGISSFRCSTSGTFASGAAIAAPANGDFWIYLAATHAAGEFLWQDIYIYSINPGSKGGQGGVYSNAATLFPYSLAIAGGRPLTPDDFISISLWCDKPNLLVQGTLVLDVDSGTTVTHTAADGTQNAYVYTFKQGNLQPLINNAQTSDALRPGNIQDLLQANTNLEQITPIIPAAPLQSGQTSAPVDVASTAGSAPPVPTLLSTTGQLYTGSSQWTELKIKISDFVRVGSSQQVDLTTVRAIMLNFTVTNNIVMAMGGMWAGGTYGPNVGNNLAPFIYRYRYRNSLTGAKSLPGPAIRSGVTAYRQAIQLVATASPDAQVDKIDWERLGGANVSISGDPDWHYLGTCSNSSPTIIDDQYSAAIVGNAPLDTNVFQPFPIAGAPISGSGTVAGTAIKLTSGTVSTSMAVGTQVLVNGILTTLYAIPSSTTLFHVADSMGSGTSVSVEIQEPILTAQPLPVMWGPFQETLFACGNALDVGSLYFTNSEDPDSASDANRLSITAPSETLMNGFVYNSKAYVFSDLRLFEIIPTGNGDYPYSYNEIIKNKGLTSRWAFTIGPSVWFVSNDGIYEWGPSGLANISESIGLLFPKGDRAGQSVNGLNPVNMTGSLRLTYYNSFLYFDYVDNSGAAHTLVYDVVGKGWYPDTYFSGTSTKVVCRLNDRSLTGNGEVITMLVGANNGRVYTASGTSDDTIAINWEVDTPALDFGDPRVWKTPGDVTFDTNTGGVLVAITPWINSYTSSLPAFSTQTSSRTLSNPATFQADLFIHNLAFKFIGSSSDVISYLYTYDVSYLMRPEDTNNRITDWDNAGYQGNKFLQGFMLEANTYGVDRTVYLQVDNTTISIPFIINHNGQLLKPYVVNPAYTGHMFRLVPQDANEWQLFSVRWVWEPAPEYVTYWETQTTTHDMEGYSFLKDGYITLNSTAEVTLTVVVDGVSCSTTLPSTGGLYKKLYTLFNGAPGGSPGLKGKLFKYILSSTQPFQLFQKDSEVRVHSWTGGPFLSKQPFGDVSRIAGARI